MWPRQKALRSNSRECLCVCLFTWSRDEVARLSLKNEFNFIFFALFVLCCQFVGFFSGDVLFFLWLFFKYLHSLFFAQFHDSWKLRHILMLLWIIFRLLCSFFCLFIKSFLYLNAELQSAILLCVLSTEKTIINHKFYAGKDEQKEQLLFWKKKHSMDSNNLGHI